jgi:hypothetical protein
MSNVGIQLISCALTSWLWVKEVLANASQTFQNVVAKLK